MIYVNFRGTRDPLTETHINLGQIHHIGNNWLGAIFFSSGDSHTKGVLVLLHLGLERVTEVDNDPKGKFVFFKVTPSNDRVLCVYAPSGHSTKNYMKNKNEGNENKMILGHFNCTMNKMERDGRNKRL